MTIPSINSERLLNRFLELVRIYAVSRQERPCADYIVRTLNRFGIKWTEDAAGSKIGGNTGNIIARIPGHNSTAPSMLFAAHMDTVEPASGIVPVIENGKIRSKGDTILGADDRVGVAAMLELAETLTECKCAHRPVELVFTIAEEIGLKGAINLDMSKLESRLGYVLDVGNPPGNAVNRAPSHIVYHVKITGKASHAGVAPDKGIHAIRIAANAISKLSLGKLDDVTTANVGVISGGTATNVVPAEVNIEGEVRSHNRATLDAQIKLVEETFKSAAEALGGSVEIQLEEQYKTYHMREDSAVVRELKRADAIVGLPFALETTCGGSDANIFNAHGIETIVLGMGMSGAHSVEEEADVAHIEELARLLCALTIQESPITEDTEKTQR